MTRPKKSTNFLNPISRGYVNYANGLYDLNDGFFRSIKEKLEAEWLEGEKSEEPYVILLSGALARREAGRLSRIELICLTDDTRGTKNNLTETLHHICSTIERTYLPCAIRTAKLSSHKENTAGNAVSTMAASVKIAESEIIAGNPIIYLDAIELVEKRFRSVPGHRLLVHANKQVDELRETVRQGRDQHRTHYDLDKQIAYYARAEVPNPKYPKSFKPVMELVRATLRRDVLDLIRQYPSEEIVSIPDLPQNTVGQFAYAQAASLTNLSPDEIGRLADHYWFFMRMYHASQWLLVTKRETAIDFDRTEVMDRIHDVLYLTKNPIITRKEN